MPTSFFFKTKLFMLTALLAASFAIHAGQPDAPQRITPIVPALNNPWSDGYINATGGCEIISEGGKLPLATIDGQKGLSIQVTGTNGNWNVGLARKGWVRWYLDDYVPGGHMEFQACGAAGGERFKIGFADADLDGPGPDTDIATLLPISKYGALTQTWQTFRIPLEDFVAAQPRLQLHDCIKVLAASDGEVTPLVIYLKEIRFVTNAPEKVGGGPCKFNQVGYRPAMVKRALFTFPAKARLIDAGTQKVVYEAECRNLAMKDPASGDDVWEFDFSSVKTPGKYALDWNTTAPGLAAGSSEGRTASATFEIREDIYDELFRDSARFYYYQRCGVALDEKHAGAKWVRPACHTADSHAVTKDGKDPRDVTGGWHDAGDCNKYPPWIRFSVFMMLDLHEMRAAQLPDGQFNIPESGNGIPDLIDEVKFELDWLLKMQITSGPQAGAIYDRIHASAAPQNKQARVLQEERRLLPPTPMAAAISVACWTRAIRAFDSLSDPAKAALADTRARYLAAAELAWKHLLKHNDKLENNFIAAAGLYDITGSEEYLLAATAAFDKLVPKPYNDATAEKFMWADYDCSVCILACGQRDGNGLREKARAALVATADRAVKTWRKDPYSVPLWNSDHYCWSSSQHIGKMGYYALMANRFAPKEDYPLMAADGLHYMLGRNATDYCLVSGYGSKQTELYHAIFGRSHEAFQPLPPGIIGGGVNQQESRGISAWPARSYRSDPNNWTITEPAIYYNAPLVFLAGFFSELK